MAISILIRSVDFIIDLYIWMIIARALMSWFHPNPRNTIVRFIDDMTEPVLSFFRNLLPSRGYGIDFSPILAIVALQLLQRLLHRLWLILFY